MHKQRAVVENARPVSISAGGAAIRGYHFTKPERLCAEDKRFIFDGLFPVGRSAFKHGNDPVFARDVYDHVFGCDNLIVVRADGSFKTESEMDVPRPLAFIVWNTIVTDTYETVAYLSGICVNGSWHGRGIGAGLIKAALKRERYTHAFLVTQNPVMQQSFDKALSEPSKPWGNAWRRYHYGARFAAYLGKEDIYDSESSILVGNYPDPLYSEKPTSQNEKYAERFAQLDYERGDAFLCYGVV